MKKELRHPFIEVEGARGVTYGGNQRYSRQNYVKKSGCGVIASCDLLLYLSDHRGDCKNGFFADALRDNRLTLEEYNDLADRLRRHYLPVVPNYGINGFSLAIGLNAYFMRYKLPFTARWGVGKGRLWSAIDEMLSKDLPVIFSIGNQFPRFWRKDKLGLYPAPDRENHRHATATRAHYVTVTAADENWLRISSWGGEYYISKAEYCRFVDEHSNYLFSNILYLKEKKRG
ncbi:MAG: hypothetical protein IIY11_03545 [Clostridia bacterium]|nr:hypothetical protein [Clostridia bacterium]MBQ2325997.1 hypothetical protein [Clostridia bacterium]